MSLRKTIKEEAIERIEKRVSDYRPFENLVDIYADMRVQQVKVKDQLAKQPKNEILLDALSSLEEDIKHYESELLIN